ncbi:MAG: nucleotide exchange factor GrpE [Nitrospirota bacterium]
MEEKVEDKEEKTELREDEVSSSDIVEDEGKEEDTTDDLKGDIKKKEDELKELNDKYIRLHAEFDNYKKRTLKDKIEFTKYSNESIIKDILPIIDNMERAIAHSEETEEFEKMVEGIKLINKQMIELLKKFGVTVIDSLNKHFDPSIHQAIAQREIDDKEDNIVIEESQRGYILNDRVIRPSLVIVSKKKNCS